MASEGGANGDVGGRAVEYFANHNHIPILADDVPQSGCKGEADLRIHVDLVDTVHLIFDRVLDGDDLLVGDVDAFQRRVERGRFAAAGGPGHEEDAVRQGCVVLHAGEEMRVESQAAQVVKVTGGAVEQTHHDALAIQRGQR